MPKDEAKECIALLRRMEKEFPMGKRYRMLKLPNYQIQCKKCQRPLDFDVILYKTDELLVDVEPCPDCIAKAIEEAAQAGEGE